MSGRAAVERDGEAAFEHALHGGTGRTRVQYHFAGRTSLPIAVQTWILAPGSTEGSHAHADPALEELYLVVAGTARMRVDGAVHELGPGDSVLCPPGTEHDVVNAGPGDLRLVVVWGPPGAADFSGYATHRKALAARKAAGPAGDG